MQATITYCLTEAAQRAQMAATGQPVAHKETMTIEVTADDLPLCRISEDGGLSIDVAWYRDDLRAVGWDDGPYAPHYAPDVIADIRRGQQLRAAAQTAEAARESGKTAAIDAYVAASGDALLIAQHADGLLGRKTILALMANAALDAAGLPGECPDSVVCRDRHCPCYDNVVESLPPAVYAVWRQIALRLPEDYLVSFNRVRNCRGLEDWDDSEDRAGDVEYHAEVTIPSGPFQFERRIKLG